MACLKFLLLRNAYPPATIYACAQTRVVLVPGAAIEDQELLLNKNGLGDHRTDAARPQESGNRSHDVDEKDDEIAHSVSLQERLTPVIVP
jgi:hypothetical protein